MSKILTAVKLHIVHANPFCDRCLLHLRERVFNLKGAKMKDMNAYKNYRTKYKRFYDINFDKSYHIHHIDFDRTNNDITNLLLLPGELHTKYHLIINAISICPEKPKADGIIV
ncbi:MAG: HNH endonuclease [Acutalibacteraceae bacterium]